METVTLTPKELRAIVQDASATGARIALAEAGSFEQDLPEAEIRKELGATCPKKWSALLVKSGAKPTRRIGHVNMYLLSAFLKSI